jgi:hypothetical protein
MLHSTTVAHCSATSMRLSDAATPRRWVCAPHASCWLRTARLSTATGRGSDHSASDECSVGETIKEKRTTDACSVHASDGPSHLRTWMRVECAKCAESLRLPCVAQWSIHRRLRHRGLEKPHLENICMMCMMCEARQVCEQWAQLFFFAFFLEIDLRWRFLSVTCAVQSAPE